MSNLGKAEQPKEVVLGDGNTYKLAPLNLNSMIDIEDHFKGKPFAELFREGSAKPLRYQFYVRLKKYHPEITEEQAGELITAKAMAGLQKDIEDQLGMESKEG